MPPLLVVMNSENRLSRLSAAMPAPVSATSISTIVAARRRVEIDDLAPRARRHRLDRVADEVDQHLLDLDPVGADPLRGRIELEPVADAARARSSTKASTQASSISCGRCSTWTATLPRDDQVAQPAHDLAGAVRGRLGRRRARRRAPSRGDVRILGDPLGAADEIGERGERLVELVRERRGHRPHRAQPRDVDQLGLHPPDLGLGAVPLGEVGHRADRADRAAVGVADDEAAVEHVGIAAVVAAEAIGAGPAPGVALDRVRQALAAGSASRRDGCAPPTSEAGRAAEPRLRRRRGSRRHCRSSRSSSLTKSWSQIASLVAWAASR